MIAELEDELTTRKGFAARVEAPAGMRHVGSFVCILGLLVSIGGIFQGLSGAGVLTAASPFFAVGSVVIVLGLLNERRSTWPLHRKYLARGWVSLQVPCGLVQDDSGDSSVTRRDRRLGSGERDDATPIMLVGGPGQSAESIEAAAAAARDELAGMAEKYAWTLAQRVWKGGLYVDGDAAEFLPVPAGMAIIVQKGSSPFVLVIPPPRRARRGRRRYYGIKDKRGIAEPAAPGR